MRFETRRIRRSWVGNVVAIGNANGFVEPLEATNIQVICNFAERLARSVMHQRRITPEQVEEFNLYAERSWNSVRDFLAAHYKFNTARETPFWRHACRDTPLGDAEGLVACYRERGPDLEGMAERLPPGRFFGVEGYMAILVGCGVPFDANGRDMRAERARFAFECKVNRAIAARCSDPAQTPPAGWADLDSALPVAEILA